MNPRNNVRWKRKANKRMRAYNQYKAFNRIVQWATLVSRVGAAMNHLRNSRPLPDSFLPGGVSVPRGGGGEYVIPRRVRDSSGKPGGEAEDL